jgi:hypothetical protein
MGTYKVELEFETPTKAIDIGKLSVEMTTAAGSGHPVHRAVAGASGHGADVSPDALGSEGPVEPGSDRLVLSEGTPCRSFTRRYADLGG